MKFQKIEFNVPIDDAIFKMPAKQDGGRPSAQALTDTSRPAAAKQVVARERPDDHPFALRRARSWRSRRRRRSGQWRRSRSASAGPDISSIDSSDREHVDASRLQAGSTA